MRFSKIFSLRYWFEGFSYFESSGFWKSWFCLRNLNLSWTKVPLKIATACDASYGFEMWQLVSSNNRPLLKMYIDLIYRFNSYIYLYFCAVTFILLNVTNESASRNTDVFVDIKAPCICTMTTTQIGKACKITMFILWEITTTMFNINQATYYRCFQIMAHCKVHEEHYYDHNNRNNMSHGRIETVNVR